MMPRHPGVPGPVGRFLLLAAVLLGIAGLVIAAPTPTVTKSFSPGVIVVNGTSTLTITLTAADVTPVTGVAFTDNYPAGLVNSATPNLTNTCGGTASATGGGNSLSLSGATIPGGGSCSVTVQVTSAAAGAYNNSTGPVTTTNAGTAPAASATLNVTSASRVSDCTCGTQNGQFTLASIAIDGASDASGNLTGWDAVKADQDNNTCDAVSQSSPFELGGADGIPDQPQNVGRDITWFATTWDSNNIYFFTERLGSSSNIQRFLYYADTNTDNLMNSGEYVIHAEWQGSNRSVTIYRHTYNPVNPAGDSLTDTAGFADGYTLPGTVTINSTPLYTGTFGATGGLEFEFKLAWSDLGFSGPVGIRWHISASNGAINSNNPPTGVQDNLGGCGGGVGSSQQFGVQIVPDRTVSGDHGTLQCAAHVVTNTGNGSDIINITNSTLPVQATGVDFYFDADGSGTLTGGDTLLTDSSDPGTDPDTGTLAGGASKNILACYTLGDDGNGYTPSGSGTVDIIATSSFKPVISDSVTDTIIIVQPPDPVVVKASSAHSDPVNGTTNPKRIPGAFVNYQVTVSNNRGGTIDADTTLITDAVPANTVLYVGDFAGPGLGPVEQTDGSVACGLTYSFTSLASATDDLSFSNDGGVTYSYIPVPDANDVDAAVTHLRINPKGVFAARTVPTAPACTWHFRVRVE